MEQGKDEIDRLRPLLWWLGKTVVAVAVSFATVWGVSFFVADWVSEKHVRGLTVAIDAMKTHASDLNQSVSGLNQTIEGLNTNLTNQLLALEKDRSALAQEIAVKVTELQGKQSGSDKDIGQLRDSILKLESRVAVLADALKVKIVFGGGKEVTSFSGAEGTLVLVQAWQKAGYNIPDGTVLSPFSFVLPAKN